MSAWLQTTRLFLATYAVLYAPLFAADAQRDFREVSKAAQELHAEGHFAAAQTLMQKEIGACAPGPTGRDCRMRLLFTLAYITQIEAAQREEKSELLLADAAALYRKVLDEDPGHAATVKNLYLLYVDLDQSDRAADLVRQAWNTDETGEITMLAGRLFLEKGSATKSLAAYELAASRRPHDEAPRWAQVTAYRQLLPDKADQLLQRAREWEASFPGAAEAGYRTLLEEMGSREERWIDATFPRWLSIVSRNGWLTVGRVRELKVNAKAARDLLDYLQAPDRVPKEGNWWMTDARRFALADAGLALGQEQARKDATRAVAYWEVALKIAPPYDWYMTQQLRNNVWTRLEVDRELALAFTRRPEVDPRGRRYAAVIGNLDIGKSEFQRRNAAEAAQRFQNVLSFIVAERTASMAPYVTEDMLLNADMDQRNWVLYGKDYQSTRYSALTEINRKNIKRLRLAWDLPFASTEGHPSQPLAGNGIIYVATSVDNIIAIDALTGRVTWKYERKVPGDEFPKLCCDVGTRSVALYKNKVYLATGNAHIVAVDNATGKVVWDKKMGDYTHAETFTIAPLVVRNKIIFGAAGAEYGVRGWVAAINADTGAPAWKTYSIPAPGEPGNETWAGESWKYGGGSTSITGSYDKETNSLYWPIGNPHPAFDHHARLGDNLFTNSTIVLDADSGKMKSYFNYTPNDPYDYGVNENVLVDTGGKKMWLHGSRNGHIYGIDRVGTTRTKAGQEHKCVWVTATQRVNWTKPITPGTNCKPTYNWPEKDVVYGKVTFDIAPSLTMGRHPMAYSRHTKMVYLPVYDSSMDLQAKKMEWKRGEWYLGAEVIKLNAGTSRIKAVDVETGNVVWSNDHSSRVTTGVLATGGGLVFYGDSEGNFTAVDDESGEHLWSINVGSAVHGNPITFSANGEQYVAIVYGTGGDIWSPEYADWYKKPAKGGGIMVFKLEP